MIYRPATPADAPLLANLNRQLILDEHHRNQMTIDQLVHRMTNWLTTGGYHAVLFDNDHSTVGYTLYHPHTDHIYVRHFFIVAQHRRKGLGRAAFQWLQANSWRDAPRLRLEVLVGNSTAIAFWRALGFHDYCLTLELGP